MPVLKCTLQRVEVVADGQALSWALRSHPLIGFGRSNPPQLGFAIDAGLAESQGNSVPDVPQVGKRVGSHGTLLQRNRTLALTRLRERCGLWLHAGRHTLEGKHRFGSRKGVVKGRASWVFTGFL